MNGLFKILSIHTLWLLIACSSPSNKRAISLEDLDEVQAGEMKDAPPASARDALNAMEFMSLTECEDMPCVQQFMIDYSSDFIHARKGEFAALHRSLIIDTAGRELIMPLSTIYVDILPQVRWRVAHTLHRADLYEVLLKEFEQLGFVLVDSGYYRGLPFKQGLFKSPQFPQRKLYVSKTYEPWNLKGLYKSVTWPCFVFEMYSAR